MAPNTPFSSPASAVPANNRVINTEVKSFFDPKDEKAACGVGFVVNIDGIASHKVIKFAFDRVLVFIAAGA